MVHMRPRHFFSVFAAIVLAAGSTSPASARSLLGKWEGLEAAPYEDGTPSWARGFGYEFRADGTLRTHVYWHPRYTPTAGERRHQKRSWRYSFAPPILRIWRRGERLRYRVRLERRTLVLDPGGSAELIAVSRVKHFKFEHQRPNQAMQLTVTRFAINVQCGYNPFTAGESALSVAAADLVSR